MGQMVKMLVGRLKMMELYAVECLAVDLEKLGCLRFVAAAPLQGDGQDPVGEGVKGKMIGGKGKRVGNGVGAAGGRDIIAGCCANPQMGRTDELAVGDDGGALQAVA